MSDRHALLVVGGGPAGFAAARGFRDSGGEGAVAIITDEHRMPYRRPPLTKELLRGEVDESELPLEDETWLEREHIDLISGRAVRLDPSRGELMLSGARRLSYESCVLATGAEPTRLPVPGGDHPAVRVLRSLEDLRELQRRLGTGSRVVVIGSGFIGCEIAASLRARGHSVAIVSDESAPNAARLGDAAASAIAGWLADDGVELHLGAPVARIVHDGDQVAVCVEGARLSASVVVMAAGARPRSELAAMAGIECDNGSIPVGPGMRTAATRLLAAGDVCLADNVAAGRALRVEHWSDALRQGDLAGRNAAGGDAEWADVPGFWSSIGDRTLKYAAWGDGFDAADMEQRGERGFVVRYQRAGELVGVLTHEADEEYEDGQQAIARREQS